MDVAGIGSCAHSFDSGGAVSHSLGAIRLSVGDGGGHGIDSWAAMGWRRAATSQCRKAVMGQSTVTGGPAALVGT
jgi:hypothetical protein